MNLYKYRTYFSQDIWKVSTDEYGFNFFLFTSILLSPLFKFIPRRFYVIVPVIVFLIYVIFKCKTNRVFSVSGDTLIVRDLYNTQSGRRKPPKGLAVDMIGACLPRLLGMRNDEYYHDIRKIACHQLNMNSREVHIRMNDGYPRRQILLNNHTDSPYLDSMAFFPHIPHKSKLIVLQHNFNGLVTMISKKLWGAWTIDKDDKTTSGKERMSIELQKLLEVMKQESDLTVVIYPQGRVPKNCQDGRNVGKFYPGAFYLALMSGYSITPLVNDYSETGVFRNLALPSVDVSQEYKGKFVEHDSITAFRDNVVNKPLIEEMCERFRKMYLEEYNYITKIEKSIR